MTELLLQTELLVRSQNDQAYKLTVFGKTFWKWSSHN